MDIKYPGLENILNFFVEWLKRDRRKILPYKEVVIGTYQTNNLSVDIRAKIVLGENNQPDVGIFLDRIDIGRPYCPECYRPLNERNVVTFVGYAQIGYECRECRTEYEGDRRNLLDDVKGEIRRNYSTFWSRYKREIDLLTKGKPHNYKLEE